MVCDAHLHCLQVCDAVADHDDGVEKQCTLGQYSKTDGMPLHV
jgi:hypothetical protein